MMFLSLGFRDRSRRARAARWRRRRPPPSRLHLAISLLRAVSTCGGVDACSRTSQAFLVGVRSDATQNVRRHVGCGVTRGRPLQSVWCVCARGGEDFYATLPHTPGLHIHIVGSYPRYPMMSLRIVLQFILAVLLVSSGRQRARFDRHCPSGLCVKEAPLCATSRRFSPPTIFVPLYSHNTTPFTSMVLTSFSTYGNDAALPSCDPDEPSVEGKSRAS